MHIVGSAGLAHARTSLVATWARWQHVMAIGRMKRIGCRLVCVLAGTAAVLAAAEGLAQNADRAPSTPLPENIKVRMPVPEAMPVPEVRSQDGNYSPYVVAGHTYRVSSSALGYKATGIASWYGEKFHGQRTSNGDLYDMYKFTAAHRTLPLPSWLKVTNLDNGRWLYVRVNDRGPFHSDRIIDLSYAAAVWLDMADQGTAKVMLEDAGVGTGKKRRWRKRRTAGANFKSGPFMLQAAAFSKNDKAAKWAATLQHSIGLPVQVKPVQPASDTTMFRVQIGPIRNIKEARKTQAFLAISMGEPGPFLLWQIAADGQ